MIVQAALESSRKAQKHEDAGEHSGHDSGGTAAHMLIA